MNAEDIKKIINKIIFTQATTKQWQLLVGKFLLKRLVGMNNITCYQPVNLNQHTNLNLPVSLRGKCVWGSGSTRLTASSVCSHDGTDQSPWGEKPHSWKTDAGSSCKSVPAEGARFWFRAIKAARFLKEPLQSRRAQSFSVGTRSRHLSVHHWTVLTAFFTLRNTAVQLRMDSTDIKLIF